MKIELIDGLLPGLPQESIFERYRRSPGNEIKSGKFLSPESSSALVANAFGYFLDPRKTLPNLGCLPDSLGSPKIVNLEVERRFPWSGGRHPWLDVLVDTNSATIGIESKRYEPYRTKKAGTFAEAYWRDVWGDKMARYCRLRDEIADGRSIFNRLDAVQLIKHAFGLRTSVHRQGDVSAGKTPWLVYLYAEPKSWPSGASIDHSNVVDHRREIADFARRIDGDEVHFVSLSYGELLQTWKQADSSVIRAHAKRIKTAFDL